MASLLKTIGKKAGIALAILLGVFTLSAGLFAATGEAPAALVILPPADYPHTMPNDIRVLRWDRRTAVVTSENADYVRRLYSAGAVLVLPFRKNGCLALRQPET